VKIELKELWVKYNGLLSLQGKVPNGYYKVVKVKFEDQTFICNITSGITGYGYLYLEVDPNTKSRECEVEFIGDYDAPNLY
jgi:hypothetical protein